MKIRIPFTQRYFIFTSCISCHRLILAFRWSLCSWGECNTCAIEMENQ